MFIILLCMMAEDSKQMLNKGIRFSQGAFRVEVQATTKDDDNSVTRYQQNREDVHSVLAFVATYASALWGTINGAVIVVTF